MRKSLLHEFGTGEYPNNVCSYFLNKNLGWCTRIPKEEDSVILRMWDNIMDELPEQTRIAIEEVFFKCRTLKQAAEELFVTSVTVQNWINNVQSLMCEKGYVLQPLLMWSMKKGYTKKLTLDVLVVALKRSCVRVIYEKDLEFIHDMLVAGHSVSFIAETIGVSKRALLRVYAEAEHLLVNNE